MINVKISLYNKIVFKNFYKILERLSIDYKIVQTSNFTLSYEEGQYQNRKILETHMKNVFEVHNIFALLNLK